MKRAMLLAVALLASNPAYAKTKYEPLETREPVIETGAGGTRTIKHGIDYWTSGAPPVRFQVLGIITDNRFDAAIAGDAVGSKSVAKLVKKHGGNGVIMLARGSKPVGVVSGGTASIHGSTAYGSGWSDIESKVHTSMAVIKYLDPTKP